MKRVRQRRRGKGSPVYRANSHKFKAAVAYKTYDDAEKNSIIKGEVIDLMHDPARTAPIMVIKFDEQTIALPAIMGVVKGSIIEAGTSATIVEGNYLPLKSIPEGTLISNIELTPGDGGKVVRTAGSKAKIVNKEKNSVTIQLSSKKFKKINNNCRATIGVIAGGSHKLKPLIKAGNTYYKMKAKGVKWPIVSGSKRNAYEHPHGGKQHKMTKNKTVGRNAPPGAKVGSFGARRTGRSKRK
ncbi:MAG: 50S ribosomal protein L2 [Candidatus Nanoarchaeia archaeon]|jgi:large subunit ribosomal protein L2